MKVTSHKKIKRPLPWVHVLIASFILAAVAVTVFLGNRDYQENRQMALEQFNQQQLILARSASSSIETYFNEINAVLESATKVLAVQRMTPRCLGYMQRMYAGFLPRTSIRRLDEKGVLRFIYPFEGWRGKIVGRDYSGEVYFQKARDTGRATVSGIIINEQGDKRIRVAVPVYLTEAAGTDAGLFKGVLMISFDCHTVAKTFISPIVSGKTGYAWLVNQDGLFLAHYESEFVGRNSFEIRKEKNPDFSYEAVNQIQRKMVAGEEGVSCYVSGWHKDRTEKIEKLIAYSPVHINGFIWSVAVCAPVDEVDRIIRAAGRSGLYAFGFVVFILIVGGGFIFISDYRWSHSLEGEVETRTRELRENEQKLSQIVEGNSIPAFVIDKKHIVTNCNKAFENLTGISVAELIGTKNQWMAFYSEERPVMADLIVEESAEAEIARYYGGNYKKSVLVEGAYEVEDFFPQMGESGRWVFFTAAPLRDHHGKVIGAIETLQDITERKRAEELYQTLSEESWAGVYVVQNEKFVFINSKAAAYAGYTPEEMTEMESFNIVHPEDREKTKKYSIEMLNKQRTAPYEFRILTKDGEIRWIMETLTSIFYEGKPAILGNSMDITERKHLESQLLHAQKMEAVGTLAGGISHDFNNVLQAISGYAQLLLMRREKDDPERNYLDQIDRSIHRATGLVQQLLVFSRKVESKLQPVNLNHEIVHVRRLLERTIPRMVDIELHLIDDIKTINADPIQLEQTIMNLAVNARDAMPDGGRLIIETENVVLDEEYSKAHLGATPGEYILLTVSDTGHGMDRETQEHIFEPFYTTKEEGKGTGLGLATVYGIVKSHSGYIMCYSEPGHGTTFRLYFPAIKAGRIEHRAERKEEKIRGGSETILLVDDEKTILDIGSDTLERSGYATITAESGEEAIEIYEREGERIDLVILDVGMPGMGGHKCLQELLGINPEARVIIASGYAANGRVKETLEAGAAGFIAKPYHLIDMVKKVRKTLDEEV